MKKPAKPHHGNFLAQYSTTALLAELVQRGLDHIAETTQ